jgi:hypothetical protein
MSDAISVPSRSMRPAKHSLRSAALIDAHLIGAQSETAHAAAGSGQAAARGALDWLCLAATPTFAVMALLTGVLGGGAPDLLCSAATASPLGGMIPMYVLMSAFHAAPWLRLVSGRRSGAGRS